MKYIKIASVAVFSLMIFLPLLGFRFGEGIVSEIDNRKLQENPFRAEERAKKKSMRDLISAYVSDRIGFRDDMIRVYTILNDRVFCEMTHPFYRYGKDGHIFVRYMGSTVYGKYHETFADMVKQIQKYCVERGVPFIFVFEPQKNDILPQYLPAGVHYDNRWVDELLKALDERGVRYVDNTITLREQTVMGNMVFNQKYDAGHWNDIGRFYGVNAILEELHKDFPGIKPNNLDAFETSEELQTMLPVSRFPIHEYVPLITMSIDNAKDLSGRYEKELKRHAQHKAFGYTQNPLHLKDTPRTLVFQGSHLNEKSFLQYALGEYIYVHNYQNVIDFTYFFNIFRPQCVVFEVAEYVLQYQTRFNLNRMKAMHLPPTLSAARKEIKQTVEAALSKECLLVKRGDVLTTIEWKNCEQGIKYACILLGEEYDMRLSKDCWEVTVKNEVWDTYGAAIQIVAMQEETLKTYLPKN